MFFASTASAGLAVALVAGSPSMVGPSVAAPDTGGLEHMAVTATEYRFQAPDTIRAGAVEVDLVNRGHVPHQAWMIRIDGGRTLDDALSQDSWPSWTTSVGGPNAVDPGGEARAVLDLAPGSYGIICMVPDGKGHLHVSLGMSRPLRVVGTAPGTDDRLPAADDTMRLTNYSFLLSHPLEAGHHRILVRNAADQMHEATLVRLAPGEGPLDFARWMDEQEGPPPGSMIGGMTGLSPGEEAEMEVDLRPGRYALVCFLLDAGDGKPHFMHGMMTEMTIR